MNKNQLFQVESGLLFTQSIPCLPAPTHMIYKSLHYVSSSKY